AWGTRGADTSRVYEASSFAATFRAHNRIVAARAGNHDLPAGDYRVDYALSQGGTKSVTFGDRGLHVHVEHGGAVVEQLPLLTLDSDALDSRPGVITLARGDARVAVRWSPATSAMIDRTAERAGDKHVVAIAIPGSGTLSYDIEIGDSGRAQR